MSYSLIVTGIAAVAAVVAYFALKHAAAQGRRAQIAEAAVKQREHLIHAMQEVDREAAEQSRKIHTGSADDRFDASLDVMRNDPARPGKPGA
ncbi:MAG TPA: hypothetical protein VFH17_08535 [Coriobacteriia bacterium]|nr:hypothetical protein [Coriobacteriia bacterium]